MTKVGVVTLSEALYPDCPPVPLEGTTLEDTLDHYDKLIPVYDKCREDVARALEYLDKHKEKE